MFSFSGFFYHGAYKFTSTCCMTGALLNQSDFPHSAELFMIPTRGIDVCFCQNSTASFERWWALMKAYCWENCRFHITALENTMLAAVEACTDSSFHSDKCDT